MNLFSTSVLYMGVTEEQSLRNGVPSGYVFYWQNISLLHNPLEREIPATSEWSWFNFNSVSYNSWGFNLLRNLVACLSTHYQICHIHLQINKGKLFSYFTSWSLPLVMSLCLFKEKRKRNFIRSSLQKWCDISSFCIQKLLEELLSLGLQ